MTYQVARTVGAAVTTADEPNPDAGTSVLRDRWDAEAYVASVCFKHGPPRLTGVELEWLVRPRSPGKLTAATLSAALGRYSPTSLDPTSPADPLPGGSQVTVEPGGQIELASPPFPDLAGLLSTTCADADALHSAVSAAGLDIEGRAADADRPPLRLLELPRYRAMEQSFDRIGPHGRSAMCSTAAVQVSVDAGEGAAVAGRWAATHALGPVLMGAFANSPQLHGRRTGWKSARWAAWLRADPARTAPPAEPDPADPAASWARRVMDAPVLCVRENGNWIVPEGLSFAAWVREATPRPPTVADLDYHISTLFPPVRPRGHLEVRYVDMQPGRRWALPVAVLAALLSDPSVIDVVRDVCAPARTRWVSAARHGLADRVLARAAAAVFELACERLPALAAPEWLVDELVTMNERLVQRGLCPADEPEGAQL
ncbi:MAG TPA: ergothioneine biosynthesis glutamate--cysteine ligase EgtA [Pseudonocardia sp.]